MVDLLRKMVDEAPFGMYVLDGERKIIFWSQGAEHITGYSSEEMLGKHCFNGGLDHIDSTGLHLCHDFCPMMSTILTASPGNSRFPEEQGREAGARSGAYRASFQW